MQAPVVVKVIAGGITIVAIGPVIVEEGKALCCPPLGVDGLVARLQPGCGLFHGDDALVGSGILVVAAVDDKVHRLGGVGDFDLPEDAIVIGAGRLFGSRPFRALGGVDGIAPQMQSPKVVIVAAGGIAIVAIRAVVMDGHKALGFCLRGIDGSVVLLQPDFRSGARVEEPVCRGAVFGVAAMDDKADVAGPRRQLEPGEAPVLVLTQEGLRRGPFDAFVDVAP